MPIDMCRPWESDCAIKAASAHQMSFMQFIVRALAELVNDAVPVTLANFSETVAANDTDEVLIVAPGAGFAIRVRSLFTTAEPAATSVSLGSKVGVAATVPAGPNLATAPDFSVNLTNNSDGWFVLPENAALVATTVNGAASFMGSYEIVPV